MDIVEAALRDHFEEQGEDAARWQVHFINQETRKGDLEALGDANYVLRRTSTKTPYYFSADKVVYLYPEK
nr:hypothetical protein [uncultured Massilia sp.]